MAYPLLGRRAGELPGGMGSACGGGWRRQEENGTPHACRGSPCCLGSTREGRLGAVGDGVDNEPWMEVPNPNEDLLPPPLHLPLPPSSSRTGPHALWVVVPSRDIQNRIWYAVPPSFFITSLLQSISGGHVCENFDKSLNTQAPRTVIALTCPRGKTPQGTVRRGPRSQEADISSPPAAARVSPTTGGWR